MPLDEMRFTCLPQPVFVDTDIGDDIDDALALALLLCSSEVKVVGISTVFGDTSLRARLAAYMLQVYGFSGVPVAAGQATPLLFRHRPSGVCQASVLTDDLILPLSSLSGPELLIQTARAYPGELTLLCFGPLTNVALALQQEPGLGSLLRQVFFMGGASRIFWPDWNVRSDAQAAQYVLAACLPVTMIGWNVTAPCRLRSSDVERLNGARGARQQLLTRLIAAWQVDQPRWRSKLPSLHDPLTVAALCAPPFFRFAPLSVRVLTRGPLAGWTIPRWLAGPTVRAALSVDCTRACAWMLQRWLAEE
jgi:inosine-uridine nucleoside N-ribohydrolase